MLCFLKNRTSGVPRGTLITYFSYLRATKRKNKTMSVTLRKRKNEDGTTSLRLDIWHNGMHKIETLKNLQLQQGSSKLITTSNKEKFEQAKIIALARAVELESTNYSMDSEAAKKTIITVWMKAYVDSYTKKDKRNMQGVLNRFIDFLKEVKKTGLTFGNISALLIEDFIDYLEANSTGEGASSYYSRFKKMIKHAYRKRMMRENVLDFVERTTKGKAKKKDTLTIAELKLLSATHTESTEVKRAFLFSAVSGLRWIDVKALTWHSINLATKQMNLTQSKTQEEVTAPLNDTAINLLGIAGKPDQLVFALPSANGANKSLKAWVKRAKIDKKITFHNSRHTFGTNLIFNNVDVLTTSKLLGHTSLKHTHRYVTASEEMKQRGTDKLNFDL